MTETIAATPPGRRWLILAMAGCGLVVLAMAISALVVIDKPRFGWLVGTMFLPAITSGVMVGSILLLIGAWNLPERKRWRGVTLLMWGLIALTSPAFGIMFLLPWGFLVLMLPFVIAAFVGLVRVT
jgi:MFS family permease